jgi:hypothetical protein
MGRSPRITISAYPHHTIERRNNRAAAVERKKMRQKKFPLGWDEERVCKVIAHYDQQTAEEPWPHSKAQRISETLIRAVEPAVRCRNT